MKAEELMIGDWVKFPNGIEKIIDLPYIEGRGICASFAASATLFPVEVDELEPVPLTKEILEKNGFEYNRNSRYVYDDGYGCLIQYDTWSNRLTIIQELVLVYDSGDYADIAVHQLQHALKLCGIEKEIML